MHKSPVVQQAIPALAYLAGLIGDPAVRHRGTIGGSVANNDPNADYPAACLALGATIVTNKRKIGADEFFLGLFETALEADEIIIKVSFPVAKKAGYYKFRNQASRFALVGVFVAKRPSEIRVTVTGAGSSGVFRVPSFEDALKKRFSPKSLEGLTIPADNMAADIHGSAEYRAHLVGVCARRAVAAADEKTLGRGIAGSPGQSPSSRLRGSLRAAAGEPCGEPPWVWHSRQFQPISGAGSTALPARKGSFVNTTPRALPSSIDKTLDLLANADYLADRSLATVLFLALRMGRPLFLEGEAGVGKTEIAKVLSQTLGRRLIRLQCYEGLDVAAAVYEWNYAAQMIAIRLAEAEGAVDRDRLTHDVFSEQFLIKRPLLQALEPDTAGAPVLLIDELDRTDEAFEAFLLEVLADFQVTIPELGTVKAEHPPIVVITSNRTREVHDALKRRCLYHWVSYPNAERELKIVRAKVPGIGKRLSQEIVSFVQGLRKEDLFKQPGVAETLDWASALSELDAVALDPATVSDTLGVVLKYQDDIARVEGSKAGELINQVRAEMRAAE